MAGQIHKTALLEVSSLLKIKSNLPYVIKAHVLNTIVASDEDPDSIGTLVKNTNSSGSFYAVPV